MKTFFITLLLSSIVATAANASNCQYPWQIASDGSSCGGRASTVKPGGK